MWPRILSATSWPRYFYWKNPRFYEIIDFSDDCVTCEKGFYCDAKGLTAPKSCEDGTVSNTTGLSKCENCPTGAFCTHSGQGSACLTSMSPKNLGSVKMTQMKEINYGGCDPVDFYCPQGSTVLKTYEGKLFRNFCNTQNVGPTSKLKLKIQFNE